MVIVILQVALIHNFPINTFSTLYADDNVYKKLRAYDSWSQKLAHYSPKTQSTKYALKNQERWHGDNETK